MIKTREGHEKTGYVYGIDVVRFIAALSVSIFHLTWRVPEFSHLLPFGWVGVQIFFVISGLVIANSAQNRSPWDFAVGRFLRLYPAAWCTIFISYALILISPVGAYERLGIFCLAGPSSLLASLILMGNHFIASAYWTLPIEISFYAVVYLLLRLNRVSKLQSLAIFFVFVSLPYLFLLSLHMSGLIFLPILDLGYGLKNMLLLRHAPYFSLGIFIWSMKEHQLSKTGMASMAAAMILAGAEIYCRAVEIAPKFAMPSSPYSVGSAELASYGIIIFLIAFVLIVFSVLFGEKLPINESIRKTIRLMGLMTYPYYLLHEAVGGFVLFNATIHGVPFICGIAIALMSVGILAFSVASYGEPMMRRLLQRIIGSLPRMQALVNGRFGKFEMTGKSGAPGMRAARSRPEAP